MIGKVFFRSGTILAIILLTFGDVSRTQAESSYYATDSLNEAYVTLAHAKPLYRGHRAKALQHIRAAIRLSGQKTNGKGADHETSNNPDARLRAAQGLLQQSCGGLSGKALDHVHEAINEISLALSIGH